MILYQLVENLRSKTEAVMARLNGTPTQFGISFKCIYIGEVKGITEVEIKGSGENGWLYSDALLVMFRHDGGLFECRLSDLKELSEATLKQKRFSDTEAVGYLKRVDGRIVGYISTAEMLDISNEIIL
jgi:hypothetical protein